MADGFWNLWYIFCVQFILPMQFRTTSVQQKNICIWASGWFSKSFVCKGRLREKHHAKTSLKTKEFPLKIDLAGSTDSFPFGKVPLFRGNSFIFGEVNLGENNDENQHHEPLQILYVASPIPPSSFEEDRPCHQWDGWSIGKGTWVIQFTQFIWFIPCLSADWFWDSLTYRLSSFLNLLI